MPDGGEVIISTEAALGGVTIIVADTGTEDPPPALSHVNKPFKRVESNLYRTQTGQVLGVLITKSTVDLHGGFLTINSGASVGGRQVVPAGQRRLKARPIPGLRGGRRPRTRHGAAIRLGLPPRPGTRSNWRGRIEPAR